MRILLTRHYKTLDNASEQIIGWGDSPRVDGWQRDMEFVVERLRHHGVRIDVVYSSHLNRSQITAAHYATLLDINPESDGIHSAPELNEVNYGALSKKKKKWVAEHYPQHKKDPDFVYPGGECFRQMQKRGVDYVTTLLARHADQSVLLVGHAGMIRGLVSHFLRLNYADHLSHKIPHPYIGDLQFEGASCVRYDELGKPSGFLRDGVVEVPYFPRPAADPLAAPDVRTPSGQRARKV